MLRAVSRDGRELLARRPASVYKRDRIHGARPDHDGIRPPFARLRLGREDFDRAAGLFHRGDRRFRSADRPRSVSLALSSPLPSSRTPSLARRSTPALTSAAASIWPPASSLPASIAACDAAEIDLVELEREAILEAALGQAAMQRHLAAFEAVDGDAGARVLALAAAAAGLALAGADAAADAHAGSCGRRAWPESSCSFIALTLIHDLAPGARPWRSCRASPGVSSARRRGRSC